jgi:hypothetical protein
MSGVMRVKGGAVPVQSRQVEAASDSVQGKAVYEAKGMSCQWSEPDGLGAASSGFATQLRRRDILAHA